MTAKNKKTTEDVPIPAEAPEPSRLEVLLTMFFLEQHAKKLRPVASFKEAYQEARDVIATLS
ncbi:hypothetical protein JW905_03555 [bacterium]|nr:hypothetical protein [candidate division CSSED10-310 bacterium]